MKRLMMGVLIPLIVLAGGRAFAGGPLISGVLDSRADFAAGAGEGRDFSYGLEEYANIRARIDLRDRASFHGALNLIAASGTFASSPVSGAFAPGENYTAAMELERLYFRIKGEYLDAEAGLLRLGFGYGRVWGSSDFLNPRNPLFPEARKRGVLGAVLSAYPGDTVRFLGFGAAPKNPFNGGGSGAIFGLSGDRHWDRLSLQALYAFETPRGESFRGVHRGGLSIKADVELGLVGDLLYTWDPASAEGVDGLSAGAGFDYSFHGGDFYVLAEYLFNGASSATAGSAENTAGFSRRHYLHGMILYHWNDYTRIGFACTAGLEDLSLSPVLTVEHELFQGFLLSLSGRIPLDRDVFARNGEYGELGPQCTGTRALISALARLRF
ncbi:MAG: hypothetical protein LBP32_06445 [Spirochaetaceae bacterium]|nr:hypothetical protein [Spirochaetaceae bacterium]